MSEPDLYPNAMAYGRRPRSQPRWTAARWPGRLAALGAAALALLLPARAAAYTYSKSITIDRSKISVGTCGATLTDFPLLFSVTDPDLAHTSSGGKVTDLQGDDIIFRAEDVATCGGAPPCTLDHEIEKYVNTTGELVAWVRLPSLNTAVAASDTVIYVYYGDSSVTSPTENSNGVWDANHAGVWHLHDDFLDSTSNTNNGTNSGSTDAAGQIANGQSFDGFDDYINVGTMGNFGSTLVDATYEFWIKTTQTTQAVALGTYNDGTTTAVAMQLNTEANGTAAEDKISNHLRDEDNMELEGSADAAAFNDGGWHQVAIVNRGPSNGVEIYLDGSSLTVTILEAQTPDNLVDFAYDLTLGARNLRGTIDRFANAFFDEFRISSTARTACWIGAEFENQNDPGDWGSPGFYSIGVPHPHLVYSTTTAPADKPRARLWDNGASSWRSAAVTASADTGVNWTVSARSVVAREAIVATLSSAPSLDVLRWDDGAWTNDWSLAFAGDATRRGVAVAYEQVSGAALVVYSNGTANPQYRMWNGSSWTAAAPVFASAPGTGNVEWVELASRPYSDQIALVYSDTLDAVHAVIWDGSSWNEAQTEITLTTSGSTIRTYRDVEAAYENSGDLLVAWLDTSGTDGRLYYYTMAAGTTSWVNGGFVSMVNGTAAFIDLAVEPGGDRMVATAVDQDGGTETPRRGRSGHGSAWQDTGAARRYVSPLGDHLRRAVLGGGRLGRDNRRGGDRRLRRDGRPDGLVQLDLGRGLDHRRGPDRPRHDGLHPLLRRRVEAERRQAAGRLLRPGRRPAQRALRRGELELQRRARGRPHLGAVQALRARVSYKLRGLQVLQADHHRPHQIPGGARDDAQRFPDAVQRHRPRPGPHHQQRRRHRPAGRRHHLQGARRRHLRRHGPRAVHPRSRDREVRQHHRRTRRLGPDPLGQHHRRGLRHRHLRLLRQLPGHHPHREPDRRVGRELPRRLAPEGGRHWSGG